MALTGNWQSTRRAGRLLVAGLCLWLAVASFASEPADGSGAEKPPNKLEVDGLDDQPDLRKNVRALVPPLGFSCDAPEVRFDAYLRDAREAADRALRALGHFNAQIDTSIRREGDCLIALLEIDPGPPVVIDQLEVRIDGPFAQDPEGQRFMASLPVKKGQTLNQGRYDSTRDGLINRARSRGYLDAHYTRRVLQVDPVRNTADIFLVLESGTRYRFGKIETDQDFLNPGLVDRLLPVHAGDAYSSDRLAALSNDLNASGYFQDVRVRPDIDGRADGAVPVNVLLAPRKRTSYEFRLGFKTDIGPRARADIDRRWVNRRGHTWSGGLSIAQREQTLETVYSIPMRKPLTDSLDFYARTKREDNNDIVTSSGTLGSQYARQRGGWTQAAFVEYLYERSRYGNAPAKGNSFLLPGIKLGHRELDDPLFPVRGHALDLKLQGGSETLLSATSLVQGTARAVISRPWGLAIFRGRGEVGATWVDDFGNLPKSLRFFAGGDNSVRGYGYERLAPRNADGQVIGGQYLLTASAEAMYPVYGDDWYAAAFVDVGNAFDDLADMDLQTGTGLGVRWRSPIGMVRVDVAYPVTDPNPSPRLHLGIGTDF